MTESNQVHIVLEGSLVLSMHKTGPEGHYIVNH